MTGELQPQAIVIFGASGDLTKRKLLPALWNLHRQGRLPSGYAVVGYARSPMTDDEFRSYTRDQIAEFSEHDPAGEVWDDFERHLHYVPGRVRRDGSDDPPQGPAGQARRRVRDRGAPAVRRRGAARRLRGHRPSDRRGRPAARRADHLREAVRPGPPRAPVS